MYVYLYMYIYTYTFIQNQKIYKYEQVILSYVLHRRYYMTIAYCLYLQESPTSLVSLGS